MSRSHSSLIALLAIGLPFGCGGDGTDGDDAEQSTGMDLGADDDGDGIANGDEIDIGTDPNNPDSDGDGHDDAREWQEGTNPNYEYSYTYTGDYRIGYCDTPPIPTGPTMELSYTTDTGQTINYNVLQNGDVPENFTMTDQHGEQVNLYSFCGRQIMLIVSAGWCGPCRGEAETLQAMAEAYPEVQIITLLTQDTAQNPASVAFAQEWANMYGFENIAVVTSNDPAPTTYEEFFQQSHTKWEIDGYIPTMYHIDSSMTVISADEGIAEPPTL